MNTTNSRELGDGQWLQYYEQQPETMATFSGTVNIMPSSALSSGGLTAVGVGGRRPRSSRRAVPTTLLNANPGNFRTLVQQFTGRSSAVNSIRRRGPVTLNFGSPTSVANVETFPCGDRSHDSAHRRGLRFQSRPQRPENQDAGRVNVSHQETASYLTSQETVAGLYARSATHRHRHDGHDVNSTEYSGENSNYVVDRVDFNNHQRDMTMMLEEFMMTDLDTLLSD